ncbi:MAG TPA: hypothetical protein VN885_10460 [Candidatus Acidoferrales bacterium]|nr:hypothetical protein [Candidatus Acidoferrales bacterium]
MKHEFLATLRNYGIAGAAVILMTTVGSAKPAHAQKDPAPTSGGQSTPGTFFCNATALNPGERAFHQRLTERLIASRNAVVELPKGYEFQYSPEEISVADVAQWVVAEEKCCPFFNFHIDLEKQGTLVCLGLTGAEGIKQFIRSEFQIPEQK